MNNRPPILQQVSDKGYTNLETYLLANKRLKYPYCNKRALSNMAKDSQKKLFPNNPYDLVVGTDDFEKFVFKG